MSQESPLDMGSKLPEKPGPAPSMPAGAAEQAAAALAPKRTFSMVHAILLANTLLVVALTGGLIHLLNRPAQVVAMPTPREVPIRLAHTVDPASQPASSPALIRPAMRERPGANRVQEEAVVMQDQPAVSWKSVEAAYAKGDYTAALAGYRQLLELAQDRPAEQLLCDYFRLRLADCLQQTGKPDPARELVSDCTHSASPIVRSTARYQLAQMDMLNGLYLQARLNAYLAVTEAALLDRPLALMRDCEFLVGRALTMNSLALYNTDSRLFARQYSSMDPFAHLDEAGLTSLLGQGSQQPTGTVLGAKLERVATDNGVNLWSVSCGKTPLEELLAKVADEAQLDVQWSNVDAPVRRRPVTLYYARITPQMLAEMACGSTGLIARFTGAKIVVVNPMSLDSLSAQREMLGQEAISMWRRFFLRNGDDPRVGLGHYGVAKLLECAGESMEALQEYQLITARFDRDRTAPLAMLGCAKLRIQMHDFAGAREQLLDLLNTHPQTEPADEIYLNLAQATYSAGSAQEATQLFAKLYYLNLSCVSRVGAAYGAGKACYDRGEYADAVTWFKRYMAARGQAHEAGATNLAAGDNPPQAFLMLGVSLAKTGKLEEASSAFHLTLAEADATLHFQATLLLADVEARQGHFAAATRALDEIKPDQLKPAELFELTGVNADVLRQMGLPDRAASLIRTRIEGLADRGQKARLMAIMAACCRDEEDYAQAYNLLLTAMPQLPAGKITWEATADLADVCLKMNKPAQTARLCQDLLKNNELSGELHCRVQKTLAQACLDRQEYAQASAAVKELPPEAAPARTATAPASAPAKGAKP